MSLDAPFACIIGAPRSGTTWLQAMLGAHPSVCTIHELKLFDLFTGPWERAWRDLAELQRTAGGGARGLRQIWTDAEFHALLADLVQRVYGRVLAEKPGATIVLDKSPGYSRYTTHIRTLVPHVKFIHVVRDGRDVAASLRAASTDWARSWAPGAIGPAASLWRSMVTAAREAASQGPESYLEIRYEDLQEDGPSSLQEALSFLGVPATRQQAAGICDRHTLVRMRQAGPFDLPGGFFRNGRVGGWRDELGARERWLFDAEAGDLLCDLGYARPGWWIEHGYQRWLLPLVAPVRMARRARAVARRLAAGRIAPGRA